MACFICPINFPKTLRFSQSSGLHPLLGKIGASKTLVVANIDNNIAAKAYAGIEYPKNTIKLEKVSSENQLADIGTKPLPYKVFRRLRKRIIEW